MDINCPKCGTENWLENQSKCLACSAVLRRCIDCTHYDDVKSYCNSIKTDIEKYEAEKPGVLAASTNCQFYHPFVRFVSKT